MSLTGAIQRLRQPIRSGSPGLILLLAVVAVYQPVWHAGYVWDDDMLLTQNACVVGPLGLREIWTTKAADICPVTITTLWAAHALWGMLPLPYHVLTVCLHGIGGVLLWRVLLRLRVPGAWWGAALWAIHPVQVESVAWIAEIKNTESGVFYLLAVLFFLRWFDARDSKTRTAATWNYALTLLCATLAMASKTSAMVLPVVLCLLAWWREGQWRWSRALAIAPVFGLAIAAGVYSLRMQSTPSAPDAGVQMTLNWPQRLAVAGDAVWFYLGKLAWPGADGGLSALANRRESMDCLPPVVAVLILGLVLWRNRRPWSRAAFFASAYFLAALFPVLGLVPISYFRYSFVADHFQYLASMGPLALVGAGVVWLGGRWVARGTGWPMVAGAGLLLVPGVMSWQRSQVYDKQETLWTDALAKNPRAWKAYEVLGVIADEQGRLGEAMHRYQQALEIDPENDANHNNLGSVLLQEGRPDEAIEEYQKALRFNPDSFSARCNLGALLLRKGRSGDALIQYEAALKLNAADAALHNELGNALLSQGRVDEAVSHYQDSIRLDPTQASPHFNLGNILFQRGDVDGAILQFQRVLQDHPDLAEIHHSLANSFMQKKRFDEAIQQYEAALKIHPEVSAFHKNLAVAFVQERRFPEAIDECLEAIRLEPDNAALQRNLQAIKELAQPTAGAEK